MRLNVLLAVSSLLIFGFASEALACNCVTLETQQPIVGSGIIPVNAGGVTWYIQSMEPDIASMVRVFRTDSGEDVETDFSISTEPRDIYVITPVDWEVGAQYRVDVALQGPEFRVMRPQSTSKVVEVGAEADIGALELTAISPTIGELTVPNDGSCTWDVTATYSRISVTRSQGWYDEGQLIFRTYVDDQIYEPRLSDCSRAFPNGSWQGVSDDIVMMYCDDVGHDGVPPGIHHVRMEATLGTNPMVFASQEIELDLSGCQTAPEADAGTREDVGSDDLGAPSPQANGEGGCSATGGPTTAPWFAALFFGALLRLRRVRT